MSTSIHGHEVLHFIIEQEPTRDQLVAAFAPEARFHTCSAEDMDLDGLLLFLAERGKISDINGRLSADPAKMCAHD